MDSGSLGANELPKKSKWSDNCKVYTRKIYRNPKNNSNGNGNSNSKSVRITAIPVLNEGETSEEKRVGNRTISNSVEKNIESVIEEVPTRTEHNVEKDIENVIEEVPTITRKEHNGEKNVENVIEEVPTRMEHNVEKNIENVVVDVVVDVGVPGIEKRVKKLGNGENDVELARDRENIVEELPVEEAILSKPQQNMSVIETVTLSEDSLGYNRVEEVLPNGNDHEHEHEHYGYLSRPMVTEVDDRLNISVKAAKSKEEVRDLKRKLEDELLQVRKMARKLEAKETQLSSVDFDGGSGRGHEAPVVSRLHIPVNGGMNNGFSSMRSTQELGSVSYSHPRPYGEPSVSLMDNTYYGGGEISHEKEKRTPKANKYYPNSDFLLGKEKLPPSENNRKAKSGGGGRKSGGGESNLGFGFDKKIHKKCSELLQKLRNHKHGWVFNQPVDVKRLGLHDYFDLIRHPMDLGTVKTRLTNNWYKTPREFAEDVRLTFHNAMTYNPEGQDVHIMAKELLRIFNEKWPAIDADFDRRLRYEMFREAGTPTPTSRKPFSRAPIHVPLPPPPLLHHPPPFQEPRNLDRSQSMPVRPEPRPKPTPSVRIPAPKKPKAKDPDKRDMTFDEKHKLSSNLQELPSEKLDLIVQIIKKRNTALSQHDDEIEVDIDSVDTETLWELDRFVTNWKKSQSKYKRKAELAAQAAQARAAAAPAVPETVPPAPAIVEPPREDNRADEGNVAPPPHVQQVRHTDSSSSSSSSSDSGSSSSDSDSSSSSDSGSDEER